MLKYFVFFALLCNTAFANPIVKIIDGDTIYFTENNETIKVRLQCADAFECGKSCGKRGRSQFYGAIDLGFESYNFTRNWMLLHKGNINIECKNKDKYGRSVCYVLSNGENLNHLLIENGYAVASKSYCKKDEMAMMERAKQDKKGLWSLGELENPADARKKK